MGLTAVRPSEATPSTAMFAGRTPIIYGAGSAGRHLLRRLKTAGIRVAACIDAKAHDIGHIGDMPVSPPEHLEQIGQPDAHVLVVALNSEHAYTAAAAQLQSRFPAFGAPLWAQPVVQSLAESACHSLLDSGQTLALTDCMACRADVSACPAFRRGAEQASPVRPLRAASPAVADINDVAYFITNRCTLNCTHCVEALPSHETHYNDSVDEILGAAARMVDACGFIHRFSITGGEALLHRGLSDILDGLLAMPGLGFIYLYTSGTVAPKAGLIERLAHPRVVLNISDYGDNTPPRLRENFQSFRAAMDAHGVSYAVLPNKVWMDMGQFEDLHLDEAAMRESFAKCAFTNCMTLSRGRLYRCPHQLAGVQLGQLPVVEDQMVQVDALDGTALVQALNRFAARPFIDACGRCKLSDQPQEVPAAVQSPRRRVQRLVPVAPTRARGEP
ncbi:radical SAM protein [Nitrogeniibacter aestuarii]|uniref:radical SAM protein n=1 Tax=Nitrogeniibacter aestuarii TaxID=2815343 RepID=UPI001D107C23|nr:radical SAM protein [Nitrogeniibacter aestuarii]